MLNRLLWRPVERRRLIAAGAGAVSYLAVYAAALLALVSLFAPTGASALVALGVAALALVAGALALAVDVAITRLTAPRRAAAARGGVALPR